MDVETMFKLAYPVGTDVVIVCEEDGLYRGRITAIDDDGVTLQCVSRKADLIKWPALRFIAHDGFPIRPIGGPYRENNDEELAALREELTVERIDNAISNVSSTPSVSRPRNYAYLGDPFEVVGYMTAAHIGNGGWDYADSFESEVLVFDSDDGARAMLWDFDSVYEVGKA